MVLLGHEHEGIPEIHVHEADECVEIPMVGRGASLNVAVAGSLVTPFLYVAPDVGDVFNILAFVIVVLGGMGSFLGALLGGFVIGLAESIGAAVLPGSLKQLPIFALFVLVLLFRPAGLFGGGRGR